MKGNLTNWLSGSQTWTYELDWADRLTKVSSNGVVARENWCDPNNHRIAKSETVGGVTSKWLLDLAPNRGLYVKMPKQTSGPLVK